MVKIDFKDLIILTDAAKMLKVTRQRAHQMWQEGKLKGRKLSGGVIVIDKESVQEILNRR